MHLPIMSTGKATYMLGLLPCFAILAAARLDRLLRPRSSAAHHRLAGVLGGKCIAYFVLLTFKLSPMLQTAQADRRY